MELNYFLVFCIQTEKQAVSGNIMLFCMSELALMKRFFWQNTVLFEKSRLNSVSGDGILANGDTSFSYDFILWSSREDAVL